MQPVCCELANPHFGTCFNQLSRESVALLSPPSVRNTENYQWKSNRIQTIGWFKQSIERMNQLRTEHNETHTHKHKIKLRKTFLIVYHFNVFRRNKVKIQQKIKTMNLTIRKNSPIFNWEQIARKIRKKFGAKQSRGEKN